MDATIYLQFVPLFVIIWRIERRFNRLENNLKKCPHTFEEDNDKSGLAHSHSNN